MYRRGTGNTVPLSDDFLSPFYLLYLDYSDLGLRGRKWSTMRDSRALWEVHPRVLKHKYPHIILELWLGLLRHLLKRRVFKSPVGWLFRPQTRVNHVVTLMGWRLHGDTTNEMYSEMQSFFFFLEKKIILLLLGHLFVCSVSGGQNMIGTVNPSDCHTLFE